MKERIGNVRRLFAHVTEADPERVALIEDNGDQLTSISYSELDNRASAIASRLRSLGVSRGDVLVILMRNRIDCVAILLATAQIGASSIILSPFIGTAILDKLLLGRRCLFALVESDCSESILATLHRTGITTIQTGTDEFEELPGAISVGATSSAETENVGYRHPWAILATSGSTGSPKVTTKTHGHFLIQRTSARIVNNQTQLVSMPIFHISGLTQIILGVLSVGRTGVLLPHSDPRHFLTSLARHRCFAAVAVPAQLAACLKQTDLLDSLDFSNLRRLIVTGSNSSTKLLRDLAEKFEQANIRNSYGLTECPGGFGPDPYGVPTPPDSVGKLQPGFEARLVTEQNSDSNFGELWIKSDWISVGNELDSEFQSRLVDDWLPTGDVMRRDRAGWFHFVGRSDDMIVSGGENIYPVDVENLLCSNDAVVDACVVAVPDEIMGDTLAAAIVLRRKGSLRIEEVMEFCRVHGPHHFSLQATRIVEEIPLLPSGKHDRLRVKQLFASSKQHSCLPDQLTRQRIEQVILGVWKEVLQKDNVCGSDDFFLAGGDSLRATQISGRLQAALDRPVGVLDIFLHTTAAKLADCIYSREKDSKK